MSAEERRRIILLIDADNAQASKIDVVLEDLANEGEARTRRAYGDWDDTHLKHWKDVLHERAIRPIQQYALTKGKNASDIALVVDAMDLLHRDRPDAFGLMSSDADFTPLVMHLRERGADVFGYGDSKSPAPFVNACTRFLHLDKVNASAHEPDESVASTTGTPPDRVPTQKLRGDAGLVKLLRDAVSGSADDSGWARASTVGQRIRNQSSMDPRNYGYARLTDLIRATELFETKDDATSSMAFRDVRSSRGESPAAKKAVKKAATKRPPVKKAGATAPEKQSGSA
ncbi:NYN domain-containing protein [Nocardioides sp. JQ2195]|uniref:NYN domain-containing protein n=1 Tax=Nocardioides sp. JQ2195 TaxID=2592334 RepID=UPI00143E9A52|nr:NYN domain-containing protein [Nocardioides sp. JQ2195]QIX27044.1 NYN domain-containing protein [Nocardioides sp. JQ2195]